MATSQTSSTSSLGAITSNQFLQLLVAQLQNQDPLDPVSSTDFINQLASLNTVEGISSLNATFSQVLQLQQLTQGSSLVGKTITYTPADGGAAATGTVSSVSVQSGSFVLQVGSTQVGLSQVTNVQ
jgi:flagellar basal-body rod modification protein FlgD